MSKKWKYEEFQVDEPLKVLNKLGEDGWELVQVQLNKETDLYDLLMKRPYYDE